MTDEQIVQPTVVDPLTDPTPIKIAYILDGQVVDILHTDERLGSIFLSNPIIVDVSHLFENGTSSVVVGTKYDADTKQFSNIVG